MRENGNSKPSRIVICDRCKHRWFYRGRAKYRIRCPRKFEDGRRCHSSKNEVNREIFGVWSPNNISKSKRRRK